MLWLIIITQNKRAEPRVRCLGLGTKGGLFGILALGPTIVIEHLETGGTSASVFFIFLPHFLKGGRGRGLRV